MKRPADGNCAHEGIDADVEELVAVARRVERKVLQGEKQLDHRRAALEQEYKDKEASLRACHAESTAALAAERAVFEAERTRINMESVAPSEIVTISMGGEHFVDVSRATLCQIQGSYFAAAFSGRWEDKLPKDSQGRVFLEFSPKLLLPVIEYLRSKRIEDPASPVPAPVVSAELTQDFSRMLKYLGLDSLTMPRPLEWHLKKGPHSGDYVTVDAEGMVAEGSISFPVMSSIELAVGIHAWGFKVLAQNVYIGIGTRQTIASGGRPYARTAVGWNTAEHVIEGAMSSSLDAVSRVEVNDIIGIEFDASHAKLAFYKNGVLVINLDVRILGAGPFIPVVGLWNNPATWAATYPCRGKVRLQPV